MRRTVYFLISLLIYINAQAQEYVDLGLSVNWAAYNIGAESFDDPGKMYLVGTNIEYIQGAKYNKAQIPNFSGDYSGNPQLDMATQVWGSEWRTPTLVEWQELMNKCSWKYYKYIDENGKERKGYEITGPNGNKIILPSNYWARNNGCGLYQCSTFFTSSTRGNLYSFLFSPQKRFTYYLPPYSLTSQGVSYRPVSNK